MFIGVVFMRSKFMVSIDEPYYSCNIFCFTGKKTDLKNKKG